LRNDAEVAVEGPDAKVLGALLLIHVKHPLECPQWTNQTTNPSPTDRRNPTRPA
jgi:hypothetical protein